MPIYQYKCKKCGHVFDGVYSVDKRETPLKEKCPECKSKKCIEIVIGAVANFWKCAKSTL